MTDGTNKDRVRLTVAEARALGEAAMRGAGHDADDSKIITDHVLDAALCGYEYSGLPKILNVTEHPRLKEPRRKIRTLYETPVSARMDGGNANGMIGAYHATQVAIAKAKEHGFSVVGMNSTWM